MKMSRPANALSSPVFLAILLLTLSPAVAGDGTGSFESQTLAVEAPVLKSFLQDLDRDDLPDFTFLAEDGRFVIFFQDEPGQFRREEARFNLPDGAGSLDLADVDGDGVPDICFTVDGSRLQVIGSNGRQRFWHELAKAGEVDRSAVLEVGLSGDGMKIPLTDSLHRSPDLMWDLDGDGRQDLIYPRFQGLEVRYNRAAEDSAADGPFAGVHKQFLSRGPQVSVRGVRVRVSREVPQPTDLDGDGLPEVLFAPRPLHGMGQLECGWFHYEPAAAELRPVVQELQFGVGEAVTEHLFDDFNGDGSPDLALLSTSFNMDEPLGGEGTVSTGGGSFFEEKKLRLWLSSGPGAPMGRLPAGEWTSEINIWQKAVLRYTDLTGDGEGDLCLFYYKGLIKAKLVVDIHPGLGNGKFGERVKGQKIGFGSAERDSIFLDSDLDGDGLEDMVLLAEGQVRIHRRNSAGDAREPFITKPWAVLEQRPETGREGDDGETVTLSLGSTGSEISISSNQLKGLRITDINGDGKQDLVLVNRPDDWNQADLGRPPVTLLLHLSQSR